MRQVLGVSETPSRASRMHAQKTALTVGRRHDLLDAALYLQTFTPHAVPGLLDLVLKGGCARFGGGCQSVVASEPEHSEDRRRPGGDPRGKQDNMTKHRSPSSF